MASDVPSLLQAHDRPGLPRQDSHRHTPVLVMTTRIGRRKAETMLFQNGLYPESQETKLLSIKYITPSCISHGPCSQLRGRGSAEFNRCGNHAEVTFHHIDTHAEAGKMPSHAAQRPRRGGIQLVWSHAKVTFHHTVTHVQDGRILNHASIGRTQAHPCTRRNSQIQSQFVELVQVSPMQYCRKPWLQILQKYVPRQMYRRGPCSKFSQMQSVADMHKFQILFKYCAESSQ